MKHSLQVRYGMLSTIEEHSERIKTKSGVRSRRIVKCKCDCGNYSYIEFSRLHSGNTKSCGCLRKTLTAKYKTTHGKSKVAEYSIWCKMKDRCYNENIKDYKWYGARGIRVCDRWIHSFENFFSDMGKRPSKKHSIDRFPDKDGNYEPSNCRWATQIQQLYNRNKQGYLKEKK